ncbi:conserved hypothetical protein, secreted [Beggiatoa sp. PS]|nr:conserved hypothetical protein, secreted [Beggiatoa sp. PS]
MLRSTYKRYLTLHVLLASMVFLPSIVWAATLHSIIVADVNDLGIGADQDVAAFQKLTNIIRRSTCLGGEDIVIHAGRGKRKAITDTLNRLPINPDDVVFFYYSGHGANPGGGDPWPILGVEGQSGGNLLKLSSVQKTLQGKNPRLLITIADACNKPTPGTADRGRRATNQPAGFKKLFLGYRGTIIASSSIPHQYSYGDPQNGGLFTQQFLSALNEVQASSNPNWEKVKKMATKTIETRRNDQPKQQPQMKFENLVSLGGRRDDNNWSCPDGPSDTSIDSKQKLPPTLPRTSNYPTCGSGVERNPATNEYCCDLGGGRLDCYKY